MKKEKLVMAMMGMIPNIDREREWLLKEKYGGVPSEEYKKDILRLEAGEPVAYVIGFSPFLGTKIDLSFRTLIPRSETEYWVERAINELTAIHGKDAKLQFLDVFSGSGCIGIALLSRFPNASVDFADIDENALLQIAKNLQMNGINSDRYTIYRSDVYDGIPKGKKYDAIFANPPYIREEDAETRVEKSVLVYEPHNALFAKDGGMALVTKTLGEALTFLSGKGILFLEYDDIQKDAIEVLIQSSKRTYVFHKDQFGLWRSLAYYGTLDEVV